jgi:hypothetical protein
VAVRSESSTAFAIERTIRKIKLLKFRDPPVIGMAMDARPPVPNWLLKKGKQALTLQQSMTIR